MTASERVFFLSLLCWTEHKYYCFSKVRIADVVNVSESHSKKAWWKKFVKISSKHVDFVLCDRRDGRIQVCIELDDPSHRKADRKKRDIFVDQVFSEAGVRLVRVRVSGSYGRDIFEDF